MTRPKELGRHRSDHTSVSGEALFHHAKSLSYVEHALYRLHTQSLAEGSSMAELAEASLARHFGPEARAHLDVLLSEPSALRRVEAHQTLASIGHSSSETSARELTARQEPATGGSYKPHNAPSDNDELWDTPEFF